MAKKKLLLTLGLTPSLVFSPGMVIAADFLEEIIVSATKRDTAAQDLPISLTAVGGDQLRKLGIVNAQDIDTIVPNFQYQSSFGETTPNLTLRGVGGSSFFAPGVSPVAVYNDNVYVGQSIAMGFSIFDLERVEVLRGPQGSMFGRNAVGGLVNFIAAKPVVGEALNGYVSQSIGEENSYETEAAVSFPVGDTAAARVSLRRNSTDGFFKNVNPLANDDEADEVEMYSGRVQLLWEPSDTFSSLVNVHYGNANNDAGPRHVSFVDQSVTGAPDLNFDTIPDPVVNCPAGTNSGAFMGGCSDPFGQGFTNDDDAYTVNSSIDGKEEIDTLGVSLTLKWDIADGKYTIMSTTGWDDAKREYFGDDDGGPAVSLDEAFLDDSQFWSTELRLLSNNDGPLNWQTGLYYYGDKLDGAILSNNRDTITPPPTPPFFPGGTGVNQFTEQETESYAVFGSFEYSIDDNWELRGGLRFTYDERDVTHFSSILTNAGLDPFTLGMFGFPASHPAVPAHQTFGLTEAKAAELFPVIPATSLDESWTEVSGNIALSYFVSENNLVFASAARGFKGGELNSGAFFDPNAVVITDPEFVNSFEIGYKGTGLADGKLNLNVTAFYSETTDKQVTVDAPAGGGTFFPILSNAGKSEVYGIDLEVRFQPNENWFFMLNGGYLNAEFDELIDGTEDLSGNKIPQTAELTLSALLLYTVDVAEGTLGLQLDGNYTSDINYGVNENPDLEVDGYGILNARVSYRMLSDKLEIAVFVKNLTDKEYVAFPYDPNSAIFGGNAFIVGDPRWFGGSVTYSF